MNLQYLEGIPGWQFSNDKVHFRKSDEIIEEFTAALDNVLKKNTDFFPITSHHSHCFLPFLSELEIHNDVKIVKGQVIGPVTFLTSHIIDGYGMLIKDEGYKELIPRILGLKAKYQVERFKSAKPKASYIIFFDEPILSQIGSAVTSINTDDVRELINRSTEQLDCYKGIHICGNSDWDFILSLPVDIINFDTYNFGGQFLLYKDAITKFVKKGGYIAAGLVPTDSDDLKNIDLKGVEEKTEAFLEGLGGIIGRDLLSERMFITPSCGMGALTVQEADKALNILKSLSERLQKNKNL